MFWSTGSQSHAFWSLAADVQAAGLAPSSPLPPAAMQRVPASAIKDGGRVQNRREFDVQIGVYIFYFLGCKLMNVCTTGKARVTYIVYE